MNIEEANKLLLEYAQKGYHVPGQLLLRDMQHVEPFVALVEVSPILNDKMVYQSGPLLRFTSLTVGKLSSAAGIEFDSTVPRRVDDGKDASIITARAIGKRCEVDGTFKRHEEQATINFPEKREQMKLFYEKSFDDEKATLGLVDDQKAAWVAKRVHDYMVRLKNYGEQKCVEEARRRVVTKMLGLRPGYRPEELGPDRKFAIVRMVPIVDMQNEANKVNVTAAMLGIQNMYLTGKGLPGVANVVPPHHAPVLMAKRSGPHTGPQPFAALPRIKQIVMLCNLAVRHGEQLPDDLDTLPTSQLIAIHNALIALEGGASACAG